MKKIAIVCFVFLLIAPAVFADEGSVSSDMFESKLLGQQNAKMFHNASSWASFGFIGGLLFGIIGGGSAVGVAALSNPMPATIPDEDEVDIYWYTEGYRQETRRGLRRKEQMETMCIPLDIFIGLAIPTIFMTIGFNIALVAWLLML